MDSNGLASLEYGCPSVLHLRGEIDLAVADDLRAGLEQAQAADPAFVIDMAGVTFIDARGLRVILDVAAERKTPLTLVNAPLVARLINLVGLQETTCIDVREAREAGERLDR
jgi:anti-anti-sigma factor